MSIISLLNLKGGVGKTSTAHHLSGVLAKMGRRVLVVDNDPQGSLTQGFWGPEIITELEPACTVSALYDPERSPEPAALIRPTDFAGVSVVPGSPDLANKNMTPRSEWANYERGLAEFVVDVRDDFDYILIDNPPNLYLCSQASLIASDYLIVPLQAEDYGVQGVEPVLAAARKVKQTANPHLEVLGILITMFTKTLMIHKTYEAVLRDIHGDLVMAHQWPMAKDYKEAVAVHMPISHYKPKSAAGKAVIAIADEIESRINARLGRRMAS